MPRLVSTLPFHKSSLWTRAVETVSPGRPAPGSLARRIAARLGLYDLALVLRLLRRAGGADAVLINGGERTDFVYLALASLCPWISAPHLVVDAHWQPGASRWHRFAQRTVLRVGRRLLAEVQPHSAEEVPLYEKVFGIPREVVRPLPWSTSLTGYHIQRRKEPGDAIVSGGHSYRDYPTLLEAMKGLDCKLRIGLPPSKVSAEVARRAAGLANVEIVSDWTFHQYWQSVADSRVFAMPITPGLARCTADQTLCNAMALGAIVVATDAMSSRIYIDHGRTGFLVPEGDVAAWRSTLAHVFALPAREAQRIREAAMRDATTRFSEEQRLAETLRRAHRVVDAWSGRRSGAVGRRLEALRWVKVGAVLLLAAKASLVPFVI